MALCLTCSTTTIRKVDLNCISLPKKQELSLDSRAHKFSVEIESKDMSDRDYDKILVAGYLAGIVVKTEKFRQAVFNYEYNGYKGFTKTNLSNEQVYEKIIEGAELYNGRANRTMEFIAQTFEPNKGDKDDENTIAFVRRGGRHVSFSTKYLYQNAPRKANTIMHEWLHLIGFEHEKEYTDTRGYSVPYAVGDIVQEISYDFLKQECWWN